jgi:hypothetical protein
LFGPTVYRLADEDNGIKSALQAHDAILEQRPLALAVTQLPHDATFRACQDRFEWQHEHITIEPHELLRSSIEAPFGKDPQAPGFKPLLFSQPGLLQRIRPQHEGSMDRRLVLSCPALSGVALGQRRRLSIDAAKSRK